MTEQGEAEQALRSEFDFEAVVANQFFGLQITANETKTAQGRLTIWNKTSQLFRGDMESFASDFAKQKAVELAVHLLTETTKTTATAAGTATRTSLTLGGFAKEAIGLIGSTVKWIGLMAAKLFAWLASLGPLGLIAGTGLVIGAIAAVKGIIKAISFGGGGEVEGTPGGQLAIVGDNGPEILAPRKDFFDVLNTAPELRGGQTVETQPALTKEDLTDSIREALAGATFDIDFDAESLSLQVAEGSNLREQTEF